MNEPPVIAAACPPLETCQTWPGRTHSQGCPRGSGRWWRHRGHHRGTEACFTTGRKLAYVYSEQESGRRSAASLLTKDEARRIAANITKLPELLKRPE